MLMDHGESFYYYSLTQKRETWNRSIGWYSFEQDAGKLFSSLSNGRKHKTGSGDVWKSRKLQFCRLLLLLRKTGAEPASVKSKLDEAFRAVL